MATQNEIKGEKGKKKQSSLAKTVEYNVVSRKTDIEDGGSQSVASILSIMTYIAV